MNCPVPAILEGEADHDVALFSEEVRQRLPGDMKNQADAVLRALKLVELGEFDQSHEELRDIPRTSPYADWRLLVRGLTAWYENDFLAATEAWSRLDAHRRAARIAAVLIAAGNQTDSKTSSDSASSYVESAGVMFLARANSKMIEHVRRIRDQRPALQLARQMAAFKHRDSEKKLSASQIAMLFELRDKFSDCEPLLVKQISDACVGLAFEQPQPELFALLTKRLPGPVHDPSWTLALSEYLDEFTGAEAVRAKTLRRYLDVDLANNSAIPNDLRRALTSLTWHQIGDELLKGSGPIWNQNNANIQNAIKAYDRSAEAWPQNRDAYEGLVACINKPTELLGRYQPKKKELTVIAKKQAQVRERWIKALPEEVEPRLWLIDHYLQNGNTERAGALIESLSQNRLESTRLKMLPWKVCLFDVLATSKKKREIERAKASLNRAAAIWPAWLSRDLVLFLEAALELRAGDLDAFTRMQQAAIQASGLPQLVVDVMTLATLQMVNLPSNEIKPFRAPVEEHVNNVESLAIEDLAKLGSFFWDLTLTGLSYPAWRMHGSKFGEDLCFRLFDQPPQSPIPGLIEACLWMSAAQFYSENSYQPTWPKWLSVQAKTDPLAAAAILRIFRDNGSASRQLALQRPLLDFVKAAAKTESSPEKRMVLEETAATTQKILEYNPMSDMFSWAFADPFPTAKLPGIFEDDKDDWDDDVVEENEFGSDNYRFSDFEGDCNCPACQSARRQSPANRRTGGEWFGMANPAFQLDENVSLETQLLLEKLGPEGLERMEQIMQEGNMTGRDVLAEVIAYVETRGIRRAEFISMMSSDQKTEKKRIEQPKMTAEEKREFRRKRKRPFEKKRKSK